MLGLLGALIPERKSAGVLSSLPDFLLTPETRSGQAINYKTALQVTAVLAVCAVLAQGVAQVPWELRRSNPDGQGSKEATDHPLHRLLTLQPNGWQTSFEFRETLMHHLVLCGNAFVFKNIVGGRVHELIPLEPGKVTVERQRDLSLTYKITGEDGSHHTLGQNLVWHLRGASWNGWAGMEPVRLAREAIGLAAALEASHAALHANGARPSGLYKVPDTLTQDQHDKLQAWIKRNAAGGNAGGALILDKGAEWLSMQMTGVDAQHLETRRFQIEEICRAARVMPIMVGLAEKTATYASAEQMFLAHRIHSLGPWYVRLEQSAAVNLLTGKDEADLFTRFKDQALMRGDYKSRQEGLQIQRRNGVINADEWRALEDMNPRGDDGGREYIVERNMGPNDGATPAAAGSPMPPKDQ